MKNLDLYALIALIIVIVGGLILGLIGLFNIYIFGSGWFARLLYIVIAVAAGYLAYLLYLERFKKS